MNRVLSGSIDGGGGGEEAHEDGGEVEEVEGGEDAQ